MAKAHRATRARTSARKAAPRRRHTVPRGSSSPKLQTRSAVRQPSIVAPAVISRPPAASSSTAIAAPARKPTYHEAVALYERGLQALQRRDFAAAADALRSVIQQYPDERELLERARLYLKVCERELEPREPAPRTADEWVYAATVALNAGNEALALQHLQRALAENPRHDHAHYMMAVASARRADLAASLQHLHRAVALNQENRALARQDPDLEALRVDPTFREVLESPVEATAPARPAPTRPRRPRR
jgi:tetratricopeptide (TPR) repeat protein